jgi:hypothetical protein
MKVISAKESKCVQCGLAYRRLGSNGERLRNENETSSPIIGEFLTISENTYFEKCTQSTYDVTRNI